MKREEQKIENTWKMEDMYSSDQAMENDLYLHSPCRGGRRAQPGRH